MVPICSYEIWSAGSWVLMIMIVMVGLKDHQEVPIFGFVFILTNGKFIIMIQMEILFV